MGKVLVVFLIIWVLVFLLESGDGDFSFVFYKIIVKCRRSRVWGGDIEVVIYFVL